jgi:hypothetical protein
MTPGPIYIHKDGFVILSRSEFIQNHGVNFIGGSDGDIVIGHPHKEGWNDNKDLEKALSYINECLRSCEK